MPQQDLEIRILPRQQGDGYRYVLTSPAGEEADLPFDPRLASEELEDLHLHFEKRLNLARKLGTGDARAVREEAGGRELAERIGGALFDALFPKPRPRILYERSRERALETGALRLIVRIDPKCPRRAWLGSLPWEMLYCSERREFLSLYRQSPVLRHIEVEDPPRPAAAADRLAVLVVISSPRDLPGLDLDGERQRIEKALARHRTVEVDFLEGREGSLETLHQVLGRKSYQVLHFMGHGSYHPESGEGTLAFTAADGNSQPISGPRLAHLLHDFPTLRMVVLNACESALASHDAEQNPFAGVANALLLGGIPAVVAMQFPISDQAAIVFGEELYRRLAEGDGVDAAVAAGRQRVDAELGSAEWATPVLFVSTRDDLVLLRRRRRLGRPLAAVLGILVALIAVLALVPSGAAEIDLELEATRLEFELAKPGNVLDGFGLERLMARDLADVEPPPSLAADPSDRFDGRRPLILESDESRLTLEPREWPAGARVVLESEEARQVHFAVTTPEGAEPVEVHAALTGRLRMTLPGSSPRWLELARQERLTLVPRHRTADLRLVFARFEGNEVLVPIPVRELVLYDVVETETDEGTVLERVSALRSGTLSLPRLGREHELGAGEVLRLDLTEGVFYRLELGDGVLKAGFRGRVHALGAETAGGPRRDLMPTLLEAWTTTAPGTFIASLVVPILSAFAYGHQGSRLLADVLRTLLSGRTKTLS